MKFFVIAFMCVVAGASAQTLRPGAYNPFQQKKATILPQTQNYKPYKPVTTRPPYRAVTVTPSPARSTFAPFASSTPAYVRPTTYYPTPAPKYYTSDSGSANILKSGNEIAPDGSYNWFFENDDGTAAQAQGYPRTLPGNPPELSQTVQGAFSWVAPDGTPIEFTYVADENGYQPRSNAIPTAPPIPELIARALAYIETHTPRA